MEIKVKKVFKLIRKLGSGSFGEIFLAVNLKTNEDVAVKLEPLTSKHPQLEYEAKLYQYLRTKDPAANYRIPRLHYFGTEGEYNVMVIDLLGPNLEELFNLCNRVFSLKTVLMIADQMIQLIEFVHSSHFLHRDIKPSNFLIGLGQNKNKIYLIDFGLAKHYMKKGVHIPYREDRKLTGTARYASINAHLGIEQGRRDDLEALCYVLLYFLKGSLPWQNLRTNYKHEKFESIREIKLKTPLEILCKGLPHEFVTLIAYCRNIRFEDEPNYSFIRNILKDLFTQSCFELDYQYDWNLIHIEAQKHQTNCSKQESSGGKPIIAEGKSNKEGDLAQPQEKRNDREFNGENIDNIEPN
jgi:serine/threonine protein kinase